MSLMKSHPAPELAYATLATALAVAVAMVCERLIGLSQLSLVFITAVMFVAVRTRMWVAVYAARSSRASASMAAALWSRGASAWAHSYCVKLRRIDCR